MPPTTSSPELSSLIRRLDDAVSARDTDTVCQRVKEALADTIGGERDIFDPALLRPGRDRYARRLVHKDPEGRYSVVLMVWAPGQRTDLHDHAGRWCVECVHRGSLRVTSFQLTTAPDAGILRFREVEAVHVGPGDAGALIPPFEYHTIENRSQAVAVTTHVYAAELTECNVFLPVDGGYRRDRRIMTYTD